MSAKKDKQQIYFRFFGGSRQMRIRTGNDIRRVADLDEAHWTIIGMQTDSMVGDKDFINAMDADRHGRIRCDDVKAALKWTLGLLKDLSGMEKSSDFLAISSLDLENPEAVAIAETIRIALENLGLPDQKGIHLDQISDSEKIVSDSLQNGDGIIPPDHVADPLVADCIRSVMALIGKHPDLNGLDGVNLADLDSFESQANGYLNWLAEYDRELQEILPFGQKTKALLNAMRAIKEKTDELFFSISTMRFCKGKLQNPVTQFDPMDPASVKTFLEKAPIANPSENGELNADCDSINPLWCDCVNTFFAALSDVSGKTIRKISADDWLQLKNKLSPLEAWLAKKNTAIFDDFDAEKLRSYRDAGTYSAIRRMITDDAAVADDLKNCKNVRKLILFQKNMLTFLNNFVSLDHLFDENQKSMIQVGRLVMDGRIFTLCTLVPNPDEHKKIAMASDICVMYLDITRGAGADAKAMKLAVAVTSGDVRNIFIGKRGVFFTDDGSVWDAKIFDFVKQPVSIGEAIKEPFYKFADFLQKQADKYFSTKSKTYETNLAKSMDASIVPPPIKPQTPAISGSMVLMGGGIGIAAIGSAFAFMAKTLQGISVGTILAVFFGILLIFGGPIIAVALVKLFHRNLSRFFEANGYAINAQLYLSLKMGRIFTRTPKLPFRVAYCPPDFLIENSEEAASMRRKKIFWTIILLILLAVGGFFAWPWCRHAGRVCIDFFKGMC